MRTALRIPVLLGLLIAVAHPVSAQTAPPPSVAPTPWPAHPTGTYALVADVGGTPHAATVVLSDSAGSRHAVLTDEEGQSHPMQVTVTDLDLVLETDTPKGHMTIKFQRRGDAITGSRLRDLQGGDITGTVKH